MTGNERGLLEVFLERQDEAIARLDMRLSSLESKQISDQATNTARFTALEANLEKIAQRLDELSHTLTRLDNLADAGDWLVNNWRKLLAVFAFVVVVLEVITRILVVWPLR